jgi:UDP-glucose 4-epimerase
MSKLKQNSEVLEVLGDGSQLKPYIHISDAINGILLALQNQNSRYEVFNVSNKDSTSVRDIANMVIESLDLSDVEIRFQKSDRGWKADIPKYRMSSKKLLDQGWILKFDSNSAVKQAIKDNLPF